MNVENMTSIFNQYKDIAFIISILISILISLAGILPSIFVTGANIVFFGPVLGFIISLLGETIGGYITFKVYRYGLKSFKEKLKSRYELIDNIIVSDGIKCGALIFEGRIIPFRPSGFVTFAASLSNVHDIIFIISTFLGKIPSIALETLLSYDVINIQENYLRLGTVVFALICAVVIKKCFFKKR